MKFKFVFLTIIQLLIGLSLNATVYFVKPGATGTGTSWNNASGSIQDMIDNASAGDEVWVAAGTYYPVRQTDETDVRSKTFVLKNGVHLYGGFAGAETSINQRERAGTLAWSFANPACLSGNIDDVEDTWTRINYIASSWDWEVTGMSGNCYYVVTGADEIVEETILDGFCITGASGQGGSAGVYNRGKIHIKNCEVTLNYGYGILNVGGTVTDCYIFKNRATPSTSSASGAGIMNSKGVVRKCWVADNVICNRTIEYNAFAFTLLGGGGISNYQGEVSECIIETNHVRTYLTSRSPITTMYARGGGVYNNGGKVDRCRFFNNSAYCYNGSTVGYAEAEGGGIYNYGGEVANCCVYNNYVAASAQYNSSQYASASGGGIRNYTGGDHDGYTYNSTVVMNYDDNMMGGVSVSKNCITRSTDMEIHFVNPTTFTGCATTGAQYLALLTADFSLKAGSSYINAGVTDDLPDWIINGVDIAGNRRIINGQIDLGAYEYNDSGSGINELRHASIIVSPNPATESICISGLQGGEMLHFYNVNGNLLFTRQVVSETENIPVNHFPAGIYFVKTDSGQVLKWVKK